MDKSISKPVSERQAVKSSLIDQLYQNNLTQSHYLSLVEDYMSLWDIKEMLEDDIATRGVTVEYNNGGGQKGLKRNDSVAELVKVSKQMLTILSDLGLKGSDNKMVITDEDL